MHSDQSALSFADHKVSTATLPDGGALRIGDGATFEGYPLPRDDAERNAYLPRSLRCALSGVFLSVVSFSVWRVLIGVSGATKRCVVHSRRRLVVTIGPRLLPP